MKDWESVLAEHVRKSAVGFRKDELAYLALTSKIEWAIRDRLAYSLHCDKEIVSNAMVCREWNRRDLAVVADSKPLMLLEVKQYGSFDVISPKDMHSYAEEVKHDLAKASNTSKQREASADVFALLLLTHSKGAPESNCRPAIKYWTKVNRILGEARTPDDVTRKVGEQFAEHPIHELARCPVAWLSALRLQCCGI